MRVPPRNPTPRPGGAGPRPRRIPRLGCGLWGIVGILFVLFLFSRTLVDLYTDNLWFASVGYSSVFWGLLRARLGLFGLGLLLAALLIGGNWFLARALYRREPVFFGQEDPLASPALVLGLGIGAGLLSLLLGAAASAAWDTILLYQNQQPFGQTDPIFGLDVGFYVFTLPLWRFVQGWLMGGLFLALVGVGGIYLLARRPQLQARIYTVPQYMRVHTALLAALLALNWAWGYWLDRFEILYSPSGVVFGAGYTDVHANLMALNILAALLVVIAALILLVGFTRLWVPLAAGVVVWVLAAVLLRGVYPAIVQNYQVRPNEFTLEEPYIRNGIESTRRAFGLDKVQTQEFVPQPLTTQALLDDAVTIRNIRLWDYRPLKQTYSQLQEIRSYYDFVDVDLDRYTFPGDPNGLQQVTISARELSSSQLQNRTWVNTHLEFSHGYGLVMSPVNEVTPQGYPLFYIQNLPPQVTIPITITNPAIYYGEATDSYVFVKTALPEFDYPVGDTNKQTTYQGTGGVPLDNFFKRLAFAYRFGDSQILFTNALTPQSLVKFNRLIQERVGLIAPFLTYDYDPYLVVADGQLWWLHDAYTTSNDYPYSKPITLTSGGQRRLGPLNYIRNSVKIVTDAYNGDVTFYVADESDPLIQAWRRIFPNLFKPLDQMPAALRTHTRYPEDMFRIQSQMYLSFHMTDPRVFYNQEDPWAIPQEVVGGQPASVEPYYVVMRLLGEQRPEFLLIQPFTPARKDNMIAWMAARSDGPNYGQLVGYNFPKQENINGPLQVEARIDQEPSISQQLSLWNQRGSSVIRGNLLVIPVGHSLLYVEPIYLQASSGQIPQLQRVVLASQDRAPIMRETLAQALDLWNASSIVTGNALPAAPPTVSGGPAAPPPTTGEPPAAGRDAAAIARSAQGHYQAAQDALKTGDWARYGRELDALQADLDELVRLTGQK
ncbi:MAG: UPF0182 family protein [Anaerolineae bacterium]|nr:UPF0182 family protein [Anaerolineae bacterium]